MVDCHYDEAVVKPKNNPQYTTNQGYLAGESAQTTAAGRTTAAGKLVRVTTALVVFGVPLVAATVAIVGYGLYGTLKILKGR